MLKKFATDYRKFGRDTTGSWRVCLEGVQDLSILSSCLVYIIVGTCKVREKELSEPNLGKATVGYLVTGETSI
jgi:hypothetical protein